MRMVGFAESDVQSITMYQRVHRKAEKLEVVDKSRDGSVPRNIGCCNEVEVGSALTNEPSSGRRSSSEDTPNKDTNNNSESSTGILATPRRLNNSPDSNEGMALQSGDDITAATTSTTSTKKTRRTSKDVHKSQAKIAFKKKTQGKALKVATVLIKQCQSLPKGHPKKKSINYICDEVNAKYSASITATTASRYVRKGLINVSPLKHGPTGNFEKPIYNALKFCYASYIQLEQAECTKQSTLKDMSKRVNACINRAGFYKTGDDLTKKLKRDTADLFDIGRVNTVEQRRLQWTTSFNSGVWFDTWKHSLIGLGFARVKGDTDTDASGEVVLFENQSFRIVNLDETDGSLDDTSGQRGGRPPMVFTRPDMPGGCTSVNKSGYSATIICGSNAAGEPLPLHFQLRTLAKTDEGEWISVDWFAKVPYVRARFSRKEIRNLPCTFGLNEKAGMNAIELHKYISKAILSLFPDVSDEPLKRVIIKLDSGPGRMNVDMLAELRLKGVYVIPGVPNTTHVTQETDQNYGLFKSTYCTNLRLLAQARHQA